MTRARAAPAMDRRRGPRIVPRFYSDRFALPDLRADSVPRLTGALMLSLAAHALLLAWPVSLPAGGAAGIATAGPTRPARALRVSLNVESPAASPVAQASTAIAPEDKIKDAPQRDEAAQKAIPLIGYYPAARLTKMPQAVGIFDIQPPAGGDTGIGGKMTVRIWIGANGAIDRARVLSSGLPASYAEAALGAFEKLRFEAGEIGGVPVKSWVEIVIEYADFRDAPPMGAR